jgi:amino acid transporter
MVGPRVYATMVRDGVLPRWFVSRNDRPPAFSVILQGVVALFILLTRQPNAILTNVGVLLTLTSAATVAALFRVQFGKSNLPKPGAVPLLCAALFIVLSIWMFKAALNVSMESALWLGGIVALSTVAYVATKAVRRIGHH